ncbi:MAG: transporter substrate-binding domain-containing protein [Rhizobiales bacterium]|nr:transporter substrate-binding domain-containing protein [Hyphomicrobiales bacterium]
MALRRRSLRVTLALIIWRAKHVTTALSDDVVNSLAPAGKLRAAINIANPVLVQRNTVTGSPSGMTVDLAQELARRLGVTLEQVVIDGAGKSFDAVKTASCDIGFLAVEPARAAEIDFTAPYVIIEGVYAVRADSGLTGNEDVDRAGVRIAVNKGAAYDLFLTRSLKHATLVRAEESFDMFLREGLEAVAGVKQGVVRFVETAPVARLLPGRFMEIQQAMCLPKGRDAGAAYLRGFVEEMKMSGFVSAAITRAGQEATVAPPAQ